MDLATLIGDCVLAASTVGVGLMTRKHVKEQGERIDRTSEKVDVLANARVPKERIKRAVWEVAQDHPEMFTTAVLGDFAENIISNLIDDNIE